MADGYEESSLAGKVALVTGGASGIGAAIATAFAARGARVAIADVSEAAVENHRVWLGPEGVALVCDVTSESSVDETVHAVVDRYDGLDILVNCAGVALLEYAEALPLDAWERTLSVNLTGTFIMSRRVGNVMLEQGEGTIINLASQAGSVAIERHAAYCASKFGVIGLTKVLALEWGGGGVTVNSISPTVVLTELGKKAWAGAAGEKLKAEIPLGRFALPEDVAAAAVFLASDGASMVNGADLVVDGGYTIH